MTGDTPVRDLVWHYTTAAGLISILETHTLWATSTSFLNDAGEVQLGTSILVDELTARMKAGDPFYSEVNDAVLRSGGVQGPSPNQFFVVSAAGDGDLLAMWRSYGGPKESYAIGLDPAVDLAVLARGEVRESVLIKHRSWAAVRYDPAHYRQLVDNVFDALPEASRRTKTALARRAGREEVLAGLADLLDDMEQALLLIKHAGFADERELRHCSIIYTSPEGSEALPVGIVQYRESAHGIAPYVCLTGADGISGSITRTPAPLPIRAIAISPGPHGPAAEASLLGLLASVGYDHLPVVRSKIPFRG